MMRPTLRSKTFFVLLGPLAFLAILATGPYSGMSVQAHAVLASTVWVALWWITEAIPIPVTSLLPLVLLPLTGGLNLEATGAAFGNKIIFLYLGGFLIAIAIEKWNLHRRIALNIIASVGTSMSSMVLGFMLATAFLSMWISNTATSVMMLPIGIALIKQLGAFRAQDELPANDHAALAEANFSKVLMLGIAYAASIGGIATLIGTPPNLVLAGVVTRFYNVEISFTQWMVFAFPMVALLLLFAWVYLVKVAYPLKAYTFPGGKHEIANQVKALGKISYEEKAVLAVFVFTAFAWMTRSFLLVDFFPHLDDSIIAMIGGILLFVLPSKNKNYPNILDWEAAKAIPWGIILLFGGGLAIAEGFSQSGLAAWIAEKVTLFEGVSLVLLLLLIITLVNFLTEITSNTATTAMILPILAPIALTMNVHPYGFLFGAAIAASCAFMLPVATPPNAVVFGSGYLQMKDMVKTGFVLNIVSILVILFFVYYVLPLIWNIDLHTFPQELR